MSKDEEQWIEDCHENPMYAASHIMQLKAENARLKGIEVAAQAVVDAVRFQKPQYEKEAIDALAALLQGPVE